VLERLDIARPVLMVGDGATDLAARDVVDKFAAYTGFVSRDNVVEGADFVLDSFAKLAQMVLL
jgi:phosphoglycolate phosphatase-like HAD superfamily hydrolase